MLSMNGKVPLYMGLITLSAVLATLTQLWAGMLTFAAVALVFEALSQLFRNH
ncbi:MAG: hypothetical protein LAT65_13110 [Saccharospirillum sp.]|nr:hypothetical protein [Saccharospirillum sp.]